MDQDARKKKNYVRTKNGASFEKTRRKKKKEKGTGGVRGSGIFV